MGDKIITPMGVIGSKAAKKNWCGWLVFILVGWSFKIFLWKYFTHEPRVDGLDVTASAPPSMCDMWSGWTVNIETVFEMVPLIIITMSSKYST